MAEDADDGVPDDVVIVHLTRRTLPEQVEWLIMQVSFLVARVGTLQRDTEALRDDVAGLRARLRAVERATPWTSPKTGPPIRPENLIGAVDPLDEPVGRRVYPHDYEAAMRQLEAEVERIRQQREEEQGE